MKTFLVIVSTMALMLFACSKTETTDQKPADPAATKPAGEAAKPAGEAAKPAGEAAKPEAGKGEAAPAPKADGARPKSKEALVDHVMKAIQGNDVKALNVLLINWEEWNGWCKDKIAKDKEESKKTDDDVKQDFVKGIERTEKDTVEELAKCRELIDPTELVVDKIKYDDDPPKPVEGCVQNLLKLDDIEVTAKSKGKVVKIKLKDVAQYPTAEFGLVRGIKCREVK